MLGQTWLSRLARNPLDPGHMMANRLRTTVLLRLLWFLRMAFAAPLQATPAKGLDGESVVRPMASVVRLQRTVVVDANPPLESVLVKHWSPDGFLEP